MCGHIDSFLVYDNILIYIFFIMSMHYSVEIMRKYERMCSTDKYLHKKN